MDLDDLAEVNLASHSINNKDSKRQIIRFMEDSAPEDRREPD